jgi:hypothetical protein
VAIGAVCTLTAVTLFADAPKDLGPAPAFAVQQALRWLDPPAGTVLHSRAIVTQAGGSRTMEVWQSAEDPENQRIRFEENGVAYEIAGPEGTAFYDPETDTIYEAGPRPEGSASAKAPQEGRSKDRTMPFGDPVVAKVRTLLAEGRMQVTGPKTHDGVRAWEISLPPDAGRPVWALWVSAADGKPLELRDPGREGRQVVRWSSYEVVPESEAKDQLTLASAHPSARVVRDPDEVAAAERRLIPQKG